MLTKTYPWLYRTVHDDDVQLYLNTDLKYFFSIPQRFIDLYHFFMIDFKTKCKS